MNLLAISSEVDEVAEWFLDLNCVGIGHPFHRFIENPRTDGYVDPVRTVMRQDLDRLRLGLASRGVHSKWRELLFGEANRADCPPTGCRSQGK
jgi:hypothetical protein